MPKRWKLWSCEFCSETFSSEWAKINHSSKQHSDLNDIINLIQRDVSNNSTLTDLTQYYGAVNGIWQNPFERCDCHVVWYAFVFGIWQIRTNVKLLISLRKINHVLRFDDLTNFNCSPFLEFDTFGAILARNLSNLQNVEQKIITWVILVRRFRNLTKFEP